MSKESGNKLTPEQQALTKSRGEALEVVEKEAKSRDTKEGRGLIRGLFNREKKRQTTAMDILHEEALEEDVDRETKEQSTRERLTNFHEKLIPPVKVILDHLFETTKRNPREALEHLEKNYTTSLTDSEAINLLIRFKEMKPAEAERMVKTWRELAHEHNLPESTNLAHWILPGFTLKEHAPKAGPCYGDFKYLQDWKLKDDEYSKPTEHEIIFWIPRILKDSTNKTYQEQLALLAETRQRLKLPDHHLQGSGTVAENAALILNHYQETKEQVPLNNDWIRTDTRSADGHRLKLRWREGRLYCGHWAFGWRSLLRSRRLCFGGGGTWRLDCLGLSFGHSVAWYLGFSVLSLNDSCSLLCYTILDCVASCLRLRVQAGSPVPG